MKLILASASPRRAQLLAEAGYQFDVVPSNVDEQQQATGSNPSEIAQFLAVIKAEAVAGQHPDDVVLAADTIVCLGEQVLGKPADAESARKMLSLLAGTTQVVITGLCVMRKSMEYQHSTKVMSTVRMQNLTAQQIDAYVASGEWEGKAGGYGLQDNDPFVTRIGGSQSNVVGLPMEVARKMLARAGIVPQQK